MIDHELDKFADEYKQHSMGESVYILHMWDSETGVIDSWHKYCQKQMRDNFHPLDETLIFANTKTTKKDYASKRLEYPWKKATHQHGISSFQLYILQKKDIRLNGL